jgi:NADH-quinone oxidoreductase subunit L
MNVCLALIILFPLAGGVINALIGSRLPRRVVELLACTAVTGSLAAALGAFAVYGGPVSVEFASWLVDFDFKAPFTFHLDPLSMVLVLMITFVCSLIHLYSVSYMAGDASPARYFALLNLFVFAMLILVLAENLPLLYLGWEGVGFCSYALIGFWFRDTRNADAGRKAFIVTRIGDTALGIAIVWLFQLFGTESITELNQLGFLMPHGVITSLGILLLIGAMGKSAQVPLMVWLPDAMAGPTPVSALIHAATMVTAGVYLLARMLPLIGSSPMVLGAIAVTGAVTAFYGATCALAQRDLKRVLAYSTISQIGYMMMGVGCGAVTAATFHLVIHAFFKACLFLGAGCIITSLHHEQDIFRMGGLARVMPRTFRLFLAAAVCLAGVPLTGGFFSKDGILEAVWLKGGALYTSLYLLGIGTAFITSLYTFRLLYLVFGGSPPARDGDAPKTGHSIAPLPFMMEAMLYPLAALALAGGFLNLPGFLGSGILNHFLAVSGNGHAETSPATEMVLEGVAAFACLGGYLVARFRYKGSRRTACMAAESSSPLVGFLLQGWCVDKLYHRLFVRPFEVVSRFLWLKVDQGGIDAGLDQLAAQFGLLGARLGAWTTGRIAGYLLSFTGGAALVLVWLVWLVRGG